MANPVMLNSEVHRNTRIITARGAEYGENVHLVPVVANELGSMVLDYPVCLIKDSETGQFALSALIGFEPGENLYLHGSDWRASYIPLNMRRQPFVLGYAERDGEGRKEAVIAIDMGSKRVQESEGEALFEKDGSNTAFLNSIENLLSELAAGVESTKALISVLSENDLIEPAQINIKFANGEEKSFEGLYTVNQDRLAELKGDVLQQLHTRGYLQACYLLLASMGQIGKLIDLKNNRSSVG